MSHWFDGLAHTHRFEIVATDNASRGATNGGAKSPGVRVFYSSRRQSDHVADSIRTKGSLNFITFAQKVDPCVGFLGKIMSVFRREEGLENIAVTVQPDLNAVGAVATHGTGTSGKKEEGVNGEEVKANGTKQYEIGHRAQAKSLWLATDTATMSRVDPSTLEPIGVAQQSELHPDLKGQMSAAHGKRDPVTGDFFNFNLELGPRPTYRVFQLVQATGEVRILATIRAPGSYIHSMFITEGHVVLCVNSLRHAYGGATIPFGGNVLDALRFEDAPCVWYVVDRRGGKGVVGEFRTPRGFFFHSVNAWDEDGDVVCEMVDYENTDILYSFYYDVMMNREGKGEKFWKEKGGNIRLARYRFPLSRGNGNKEVVEPFMVIPGPRCGELPTYNTRFATRPHRFVYGVASRGLSTLFDCIVKTDTKDGSAVLWRGPAGHTPGEPIFVPRPVGGQKVGGVVDGKGEESEEDMAEDDGVLLSVVLDGASGKSYLLCLDAGTLEEVGRAECGFAVAFGFHGRLVRA